MDFRVVVGLPSWEIGGVPTFAGNLVRGLRAQGVAAHILVSPRREGDGQPLAVPPDIVVETLPWSKEVPRRTRWQAMIQHLEGLAPCVYLPNHDFEYSCLSPKLSSRVAVIGHIHSDSDEQYEHFATLAKYWNAAVAGSDYIAGKVASLYPSLSRKLVVIPYGVPIPTTMPARACSPQTPLRVVSASRLKAATKRVLDLPKIVTALLRRQVPVQLSITGTGPDEAQLKADSRQLAEQGAIRFLGVLPEGEVPATYEQNDVFILTSSYEGKPLSLVEAMGRGCVPVVTDLPSGIPELVHDGINGYLVPVGDIEGFADRLAVLYHNQELRRNLAQKAFDTVAQGGYRIEDMTVRYLQLFRQAMHEVATGAYHRPRGKIRMPPFMGPKTWKDRLPTPVRAMGSGCKRLLHRARSAAGGLFR